LNIQKNQSSKLLEHSIWTPLFCDKQFGLFSFDLYKNRIINTPSHKAIFVVALTSQEATTRASSVAKYRPRN